MKEFDDLVEIMRRLRAPDGCPWDRVQTHTSIRKYVIEEAYEVAEAIDEGDSEQLRAELGDLLLQVVFHAQMASEGGGFSIEDVCTGVASKLERRHPHVFGDLEVVDADTVARNWEAIKADERGPSASAIDGVPRAMPALQRAERISEKASRTGFDWPDATGVLEKLDEERAELARALESRDSEEIAAELGDLLLTVANLARKLGQEPELCLGRAVDRFSDRFREVENQVRGAGQNMADLDPEALEERWQAAKRKLAAAD